MDSSSTSKASIEGAIPQQAYRLDLAYIGSCFMGWQSQPHRNTVQDLLEAALGTVLRTPTRVMGASRTDTGVHAEHQVAIFRAVPALNCHKIMRSLQALVPESIGILNLREVESGFHPILNAKAKLYRYRVWVGNGLNPFLRPYAWQVHSKVDSQRLQDAAKTILGTHNFQSFAATDTCAKTFERTILDAHWEFSGEQLAELYILGDGFLKQMVRNLVGTMLEIGQGKRDVQAIPAIIALRDRRQAGITAPALGLSLVQIFFEPVSSVAAARNLSQRQFGFSMPTLDR